MIDRKILIAALASLLTLLPATKAWSIEKTLDIPHDFISCSVLTIEQLTLLQLAQRGVSLESALDNLPFTDKASRARTTNLYDLISKEGILNTYSIINSNYARCARLVYEANGIPAKDLVEYPYYFCAGENKVRYELILKINEHFDLDKVLESTPDSHFNVAISYFKLIEKQGVLASFDYTANNLKACLNRIQ